jgi:hypothetical protein
MKTKCSQQILFCLICLLILWGSGDTFASDSGAPISQALQAARTAGVPERTLKRLTIHGEKNRSAHESIADLLGVLTVAQTESLPLDPFVNKFEEGLAKRVPPQLIRRVLKQKLEDYRFTRNLLRENMPDPRAVPPNYLQRLTETLYCGLSRDQMSQLMNKAPTSSLSMLTRGMEIKAALNQRDFDPVHATEIIVKGLEARIFTPEWMRYPRLVLTVRQKGIPDREIADLTLEAIQRGDSFKGLSEKLGRVQAGPPAAVKPKTGHPSQGRAAAQGHGTGGTGVGSPGGSAGPGGGVGGAGEGGEGGPGGGGGGGPGGGGGGGPGGGGPGGPR